MLRAQDTPALIRHADAPPVTIQYGVRRRLLLSLYIAFHIAATLLWVLPRTELRQRLDRLTDAYINHVGLYQNWGMFAPEPSRLNFYLSAVVTYQDGSQREWTWPRMDELDMLTRYQRERFRKYAEYVRQDAYAYLWPSLARFVARVGDDTPGNPPVRVQLWRHWWFVPPPADGDLAREPPHEWSHFSFFEISITPQELQP